MKHPGFTLSPQQKRLWLISSKADKANCEFEIAIEGASESSICEALRGVVSASEILRTRLVRPDWSSLPAQTIDSHAAPLILSLSAAEFEAWAEDSEASTPFDYLRAHAAVSDQAQPLRALLIELEPSSYRLAIALPGYCADAYTAVLLFRNLAARLAGANLVQGALEYADLAEWQNQLLQAEESAAGRSYWRDEVSEPIPPLPFEIPNSSAFLPGAIELELEDTVLDAIDYDLRESDLQRSRFLFSCWAVLLSRLTGANRIICGWLSDGRRHPELLDVLGPFAKFLPVKIEVDPLASIVEFAQQAKTKLSTAVNWHEAYDWGQSDEDTGSFFCPYIFEYSDSARRIECGAQLELKSLRCWMDRFHLGISYWSAGDSFRIELLYDAARIRPEDAARIAEEYVTLVRSAVASPTAPVKALGIVGPGEHSWQLTCLNAAPADPPTRTVLDRIEEQAALARHRPAVRCHQDEIDYAALDASANGIAKRLLAAGVSQGAVIGICLERSIDFIVALIGVWKAGAAYLPLDPRSPERRLCETIETAGLRMIITRPQWRRPFDGLSVIIINDRADLADTRPGITITPDQLAYILLTSGSTGSPKSVAVEHRQLAHYVDAVRRATGMNAANYATFSSFTADLGNTAVFSALSSGACLHIVTEDQALEAGALYEYFEGNEIECAKLTPSHMRILLAGANGKSRRAPIFILGGEPSSWELIEEIRATFPAGAIWNHYGPTETTIGVSVYPVVSNRAPCSKTVPLGRPLPRNRIYILDAHLRLAPFGSAGDLYVGGPSLARGYINDPAATSDRFIPDPFGSAPGARLYKTGDLARYVDDGMIEFLGRSDRQLKIRGHRIEPAEIEARINTYPAIARSFVTLVDTPTKESRLVAYVITRNGAQFQASELQSYLRESLPEQMTPSAFVTVPAFPLTPSGKINARDLPLPTAADTAQSEAAVPTNSIEDLLCGIWRALLECEKVGLDQSFFDIGGHSLLATKLVSRIRKTFQVELPLREVFESPTIRGLARRIGQRRWSERGDVAPTGLRPAGGNLPLSFAQRRIWFLEQLNPGEAAYNAASSLILRGRLNVALLHRSLNDVIARHESLRTNFIADEGVPAQVIRAERAVPLVFVDLGALPESIRRKAVDELSMRHARAPFDLGGDCLIRVTWLRITEEEHILLVNQHHIIFDGWSSGLLLRDLSAFYEAHLTSRAPALPPLSIQYADFACWQREYLNDETLKKLLTYWQDNLDGHERAQFSANARSTLKRINHGGLEKFRLSAELIESVRNECREQNVTLFMFLTAVFKALLLRYLGQSDICIGIPIANRTRAEFENIVGFFVNTLALRTRLDGNPPFSEALHRVRESMLDAYAHQDLPFEKLVEHLHPDRHEGGNPFFSVVFHYDNTPAGNVSMGGVDVEIETPDTGYVKFDLSVSLQAGGSGIDGRVEYKSDLFSEEFIRRFIEHFQVMAEAAVRRPDLRISELPLLGGDERRRILELWNESSRAIAPGYVHEWIERQAELTPEKIAVQRGPERMKYAELNRKANHLAHYLRRFGVAPESAVGICLEATPTLLVSVLGVLKTGACYVPLDPGYPHERLLYMCEQAGIRLVITETGLRDRVPTGCQAICLDVLTAELAAMSDGNPRARIDPENLAYIIFTSGSTGKPKGATAIQKGFVNMMAWFLRAASLTSEDRVLILSSFSFDLTQKDLLGPLTLGATVCLPEGTIYDPNEIRRYIAQYNLTYVNCTPSSLLPVLDASRVNQWLDLRSLRLIFVGGEPSQVERLREWAAASGSTCAMIHGYGPTECSDTATWFLVDPMAELPDLLPIGRPVDNARVYLVDGFLNPIPVGVPGEICIGGLIVGRGYIKAPEMTASRFIPDPFSPEPGSRIYRTGDIGRWLPDGDLEFLGRSDNQVKLRGFRIELEEVDSVLRGLPGVKEAVSFIEGQGMEARLITALVLHAGLTIQIDHLRRMALEQLPDHMVPGEFFILTSLPLNSNGKIDRAAARAIVREMPRDQRTSLPPESPTEHTVAEIWSSALQRETVGVMESFFELGGHSLLAAQVIARIRDAFGYELPLRWLFEQASVRDIAAEIDAATNTLERESQLPKLTAVPRESPVPLSFGQQRIWFIDHLNPGDPAYIMSGGLQLTGALNIDALGQAVSGLVERHESLRTIVKERDGIPYQVASPPAPVPLPIIDLRAVSELRRQELARNLALEIAERRFQLTQGPLFRTALIRNGDCNYVLALSVHHIVCDGWSISRILTDLAELYAARSAGRRPELPQSPLQFIDYASWEYACSQSSLWQPSLAFWRRKLADQPLLDLPADKPRPTAISTNGSRLRFDLDVESINATYALGRECSATLFMVLLATYKTLLLEFTGQEDLSVGTDVANRDRTELECIVGLLTNQVVLRTIVDPELSFRELVERVRETTLNAYARQHIPLDRVIREVRPQRSPDRNPLFQTLFVMQNLPTGQCAMPGLDLAYLDLGRSRSKFDLSLFIEIAGSEVKACWMWRTAVFERATIERLTGRYLEILKAALANPDVLVAELVQPLARGGRLI
jgi:amino acid adenylation domain-containing protein